MCCVQLLILTLQADGAESPPLEVFKQAPNSAHWKLAMLMNLLCSLSAGHSVHQRNWYMLLLMLWWLLLLCLCILHGLPLRTCQHLRNLLLLCMP